MISLNKKTYLLILFILSIIILISAYIIQYVFGYQPCNLCLIERIPYVLVIIILIINYKFQKNQNFYIILLLLVFSFSIIISAYHLSIELGLIEESAICVSKNIDLITKEDIIKSLQELRVSCKDVAFKIFGLSLTTYNIIISTIMFLITIKIYSINNDYKK